MMRVQAIDAPLETEASYSINVEGRLVLVRFVKQLSLGEIERYVAALCSDPLFEANFSEIVDLSAVESLELNPEAAMALADAVDPFSAGVKRAFVAQTKVQVHAARMHQILRNDEENIRIFASLDDAKRWLRG